MGAFACVLTAAVAPCCAAAPQKVPPAAKMLVLKQKATVSGDTIVYICSLGMRIDNPGLHTIIIAPAPKFNVLMYNTESKSYFDTTPQKFEGRFNRALAAIYGPVVALKGWNKIGDYSDKSLPAAHYRRIVDRREDIELGTQLTRSDAWGLTGVSLPEPVRNILAKMNNLPPLPIVPLRFVFWNADRSYASPLDTKSITMVKINASLFARPPGLKLAHTQNDVFMDQNALDVLQGYTDANSDK
ncbi:MAG TPA: hypothetical protein V6C81_24925 [Planktothrix sp.]